MNVIAGDATIEQMFRLGLVRKPSDLYSLDKDDLLKLEGWKERSAERFLASIEASKATPFDHVLFALGIRYVGETTAKSLARHFGDMDSLMAASREELLAVEDIGEVIADSVLAFFADSRNREEVERLKAAGLKFSMAEESSEVSDLLAGKTIVISGNFSISRDAMKALIEKNGGKNSSSISSRTSYLLAGSKPGPEKMKKAEQLGIEVIDEARLMQMLGGSNPDADGEAEAQATAADTRTGSQVANVQSPVAGDKAAEDRKEDGPGSGPEVRQDAEGQLKLF